MNDGQYTNLRNYLEEIASKQGQIVQLLERIVAPPPTVKKLSDAPLRGTLETEPPPDAHMAAVTQNVFTPKAKSPVEVMPKTKPDFTVTVEDEQKPKTKKGK